MTIRVAKRTIARLIVAGAALLSIGCADSATAPVVTRSIQAKTVAHDDPPPETKCSSGWASIDGRWVCEQP